MCDGAGGGSGKGRGLGITLDGMGRVTVIVPSYNHASFLRACLESVRAQTFTDWDLILIDDGSRDSSLVIARDVAASDPRIQVLQNDVNLGTYGTQARGLSLATGEYVAILNSDDLWRPDKLRTQVEQLDGDSRLVLSACQGELIDADGRILTSDQHADWPRASRSEFLPYLRRENRILASGVLWRREQARFEPSLRYSGDWLALLEAALRGPFGFADAPLVAWRQHDTNSYRFSAAQAQEELRLRLGIAALGSAPWNALHLSALWTLFGQTRRALGALRPALRDPHTRTLAVRRWMVLHAPHGRRRLWPHVTEWPTLTSEPTPIEIRQS